MVFDYNQGFDDTPGSIAKPRFSIGVEYSPLAWLPLRSGVSSGGTDRVNIAFGVGVIVGGFEFKI